MKILAMLAAAAAFAATAIPALAFDSYPLGGAAKGAPSTVAYKFAGQDAVAVFVRGPGGLMYAKTTADEGASFSDWTPIGTLALKGDPSCTARSQSRIDCAAVGPSNTIYWTSYDAKANTWSGWTSLGGYATNDPSIIRTTEGGKTQLRIFVRGPQNHLFMNTLAGKWSDWQDLDGTVGSAVGCVQVFSLGAHCYDTTASGVKQLTDITHKTGNAVVVDNLGGLVTGRVSAVSTGDAVHLFVLGPQKRLWIKSWSGGSWSDWQQTAVPLTSAPGCAIDASGTVGWCASIGGSGAVTLAALVDGEI